MRRDLLVCLAAGLLLALWCPVARAQGIKKFFFLVTVGDYPAGQSNNQNSLILSYDAEFWYSDLWPAANERQALRYAVSLTSATGTVQVNELEVYEDVFLEFTWCRDSCGFEDLFATTPMPQLWCPDSGGSTPSQSVNGVPASELRVHELNDGFVRLWCNTNSLLPVRAILRYDDSDKVIDFNTFLNDTFDNNVFQPPDICPDVDPSCFRLDLAIVLDHSGSVQGPWRLIVDFVYDLAELFVISPQRVNIGVVGTFMSTNCYVDDSTIGYTELVPLSGDKAELFQKLDESYLDYPFGCTPLIKAINATLDMLIGGRENTKKALLVLSDGRGNNPCADHDDACNGVPLSEVNNCVTSTTECVHADSGCTTQTGGICETRHNTWYQPVWAGFDAAFPEGVATYAVGAGSGTALSSTGLSLIARGNSDNIFTVTDFTDLSTLTYRLAKALSCPIPGTLPCPNNCRPGGLCCAGSCECIQDCSLLSTDKCQQGICLVTKDATQCTVVGNKCGSSSGSDDQAGIIAGAVVGGVVLAALLVGLFAAAGVAIFFFQQKTMADVIAMEQAFANQAGVKQNPTFVERGGAGVSRLYEEKK